VQRWREIKGHRERYRGRQGRDRGMEGHRERYRSRQCRDAGKYRDIGRDTGADSAEMEGDVGTSGEIQEQTVQRCREI